MIQRKKKALNLRKTFKRIKMKLKAIMRIEIQSKIFLRVKINKNLMLMKVVEN